MNGKNKILRYLITIIICSVLLFSTTACSTHRALSAPKAKDLTVLNPGNHRYTVLAELGTPLLSETDKEGNKVDLFKFVQGQHALLRGGRGVIYGLLAVGSFGVSEIITNPVEGTVGTGAEMQLKINYDNNDRVAKVEVLKDDRWLPVQKFE